MRGQFKLLHAPTFLFVLMLISATCGWFVPAFYDWTGADQSRPSALMWQVPLAVAFGAFLFSVALPWIPLTGRGKADSTEPSQFNLRSVLMLMAGAAVAIAIGMRAPMAVASICLVLALLAAVRSAVLYPEQRLPIVTLLACLFLPFVWILGYRELHNLMPSILWMSAGMPGFFSMSLVAGISGMSPHESNWLAIFSTAALIGIGLGLIRVGPKPAIAYSLFAMLSSLAGSLILNALVRA